MAAPVVATSAKGHADFVTSVAVTKPSGLASGDTWAVFIADFDAAGSMSAPGMTQRALARRASGDIVTLWLFDRLATGSEGASITFTPSETNYLYWISMRITGASATPFDVKSENNGAGTTATLTGITLAETEELVLAAVANYNSPTNTNPSGFTDLQNEADVLEAWYRGDLGAGATGNFTSTQGSDSWAAVLAGYKSTGGGGAAYVRPKLIVPNQAVHRASRW